MYTPDIDRFFLVFLSKIVSAAGLILVLSGGCTVTEGVVTDIIPTENGFIIIKCDATTGFALTISATNCRNEQIAK